MFLGLRDLRFAKGRFGLMAAVVALLSLLVVLLSGLTAGLAAESVGALVRLPADRIALADPGDGETASLDTSTVSKEQVDALTATPGVDGTAPLGVTTSRLGDTPVAVMGTPPSSFLAPSGLAAGKIVTSEDLGLSPGDRVELAGTSYEVAATTDTAALNHLPVVWTTLADWQTQPSVSDRYATGAALTTTSDFDDANAPSGLSISTLDDARSAVGSYAAENGSLTMIRGLLLGVSALVVGAFFTVWTIQRTPDLAVLKAMGADTGYLVRDALAQALVVLLLGGGTGAVLGAAAGWAASGTIPFVVDLSTTVLPFLLLVVLGLAGAAASLRRVATVDPLVALGAAR